MGSACSMLVVTVPSETDAPEKGIAAITISPSCWAPAIFSSVTKSQTGIQCQIFF